MYLSLTSYHLLLLGMQMSAFCIGHEHPCSNALHLFCFCSIGLFILYFIGIPDVRGLGLVDLSCETGDCIKCKIVQKYFF